MTDESSVMIVLHILKPYIISDVLCASLVAIILKNISMDPSLRSNLIDQYAIKILHEIFKSVNFTRSKVLCECSITVMKNLASCKEQHERIMKEGHFMEVLLAVASIMSGSHEEKHELGIDPSFDEIDIAPITEAIALVAETSATHKLLVDGGIVSTFTSLLHQLHDDPKLMSAKTIANIASSNDCRQSLVENGAMEFIMNISSIILN